MYITFDLRVILEGKSTDVELADQTIDCNGTLISVAQPADFFTNPTNLCGFASCVTPDSSIAQDCCNGPMQSNGLYRYCPPVMNALDATDWIKLEDDWLSCISQLPASSDVDGGYGSGCNRVPGEPLRGSGPLMNPSIGGIWTVAGLLALMLCSK